MNVQTLDRAPHAIVSKDTQRIYDVLGTLLEACATRDGVHTVQHHVLADTTQTHLPLTQRIQVEGGAFTPVDHAVTNPGTSPDHAAWHEGVQHFVAHSWQLQELMADDSADAARQLQLMARTMHVLADELNIAADHSLRTHAAALEHIGQQRIAERMRIEGVLPHAIFEAAHHGEVLTGLSAKDTTEHHAWAHGTHVDMPKDAIRPQLQQHWDNMNTDQQADLLERLGHIPPAANDNESNVVNIATERQAREGAGMQHTKADRKAFEMLEELDV